MKSVYFDASLISSLFVEDSMTERAFDYIARVGPTPIISDFACAEFASALGVRIRSRTLDVDRARTALDQFDRWRADVAAACETAAADVTAAGAFLRRLDLPRRAPHAIHIAAARRLGAELATFDTQMIAGAQALGVRLAEL